MSLAAHTGKDVLYGGAVGHVAAAAIVAESGKLTWMACNPEPEKPLNAAYWHGGKVLFEVGLLPPPVLPEHRNDWPIQSEAFGSDAPAAVDSKSIAPAAHAASAAVCADWR